MWYVQFTRVVPIQILTGSNTVDIRPAITLVITMLNGTHTLIPLVTMVTDSDMSKSVTTLVRTLAHWSWPVLHVGGVYHGIVPVIENLWYATTYSRKTNDNILAFYRVPITGDPAILDEWDRFSNDRIVRHYLVRLARKVTLLDGDITVPFQGVYINDFELDNELCYPPTTVTQPVPLPTFSGLYVDDMFNTDDEYSTSPDQMPAQRKIRKRVYAWKDIDGTRSCSAFYRCLFEVYGCIELCWIHPPLALDILECV